MSYPSTQSSRPVVFAVLLLVGLCTLCSAGELVITGTVVTPDGKPAPGATVFTLWGFIPQPGRLDQVKADTTTDAAGQFTLRIEGRGEPCLTDEMAVVATMEGHGLGWTFAPPATPTGLRIALREGVAATGAVVDDAGRPIPGATVAAANVYQEGDKAIVPLFEYVQTTTDDAGSFRLPGLPRGVTVYLQATAPGYGHARLAARPAEQLVDETITLHPATSITGRVTRDGEPAEGVYVRANRQGVGHVTGSGGSGPDGVYTISGIPPGTYAVSIYWPASGDATLGRTATAHRGVACDLNAPATGIDFDLIEGGLLTGRVTDADTGAGIARANVRAYISQDDYPFGASWLAVASDEGDYELRLPAGEYWVCAQASGYGYRGPKPWSYQAKVDEGRTANGLGIALWSTPRIAGTVVDVDGTPVAGARVTCVEHHGPEVVTEPDGRFAFAASYRGLPTEVCAVDITRGLVGRLEVAEETSDADVVLGPGAVATGQVVDPDGKGLAGVYVTATYRAPVKNDNMLPSIRLPATPTDADGRFRLSWLPYGVEVTIHVDGEDGCFISERRWEDSVWPTQEQELDLGSTVLDRSGQTLMGRVMDAERELVPGCLVVELGSGKTTRTDDAGRFELAGLPFLQQASLPASSHRPDIVAVHPENALVCAACDADPAWGYELDMILEPPAKVRGRIVDADGAPRAGVLVNVLAGRASAGKLPDAGAGCLRSITLNSQMKTGGDGMWEFDGLVAGLEYWVFAMGGPGGRALFQDRLMPIPGGVVDLGDLGGKGVQ